MRIVVVGAGEVGSNIAASLSADHDVVVVERDPATVEELTYSMDILALEGDGASRETLREAGVEDADLLVASTDSDETNLVVCGTAKTLGDPLTIARVRNIELLDTWQASQGAFDVDVMVSTDLLTAQDIVRVIGVPGALDVDPFASGLVQVAEFQVPAESDVAGRTVADADRFESLTFAAVVHDGEVSIPRGDTVLEAGDKVVVIGTPAGVQAFSGTVAPDQTLDEADDFVIVGGSAVGAHVARLLAERGVQPRLVERDPERARELAEELPGALVMEHDATDVDFLVAEGLDRADALVAATDSDEKNLLVALLARNVGVKRTVAVVEDGEYAHLFEAVGVDVAVNPRRATAEEIVRFTQEGRVENLSLIEGREAEVVEFEVDAGSVLTGRPIRESVGDLPDGVVVGAITRDHEFVVPRGETEIRAGDHVVLFVAADALEDVMTLA
ncbi:Trk system potassium transporter TrkA [Halorubellus litoreus]|uniref:Trk system potassium transporter TrkA n=1 Tax=Halorubellus litoreus TaxID=755308 RepID=A0ABD5VFW7_9EURY